MTTPTAANAISKAKERQFQVVPVPAVFTRGRWECCDFREANGPDNQILEFTPIDKHTNNGGHTVPAIPTPIVNAEIPTTSQQTPVHNTITDINTPILNLDDSSSISGLSNATLISSNDCSTTFTQTPANPQNEGLISPISGIPSTIQTLGTNSVAIGSGTNPVAIDNKIEQAMDLVKTHLTFAVREEVEILRSTIAHLESKVSVLENENRILRQFAPQDVLQNLPMLVQNAQKHNP